MTNYDTLKEYEAHKEPLPHYDVWKNIYEQWKVVIPQLARLQEQIKEANAIIKKCADYCSVGCYYDQRDEEMALDSKFYIKKWGVK